MIDTSNPRFRRLFEALTLLALPAGRQIAHLEGAHVDELALDLHDALLLVQRPEDQTWLSSAVAEGVQSLDEAMAAKSGTEADEFWTFRALRDRSEWKIIRGEARRLLRQLLAGNGRGAPLGPDEVTAGLLQQALEELPVLQREILVLRYFSGLSSEEIAELLQIRTTVARDLTTRGLLTLRSALARSGELPLVDDGMVSASVTPLEEALKAALV